MENKKRKAVILIDGENFKYKVKQILRRSRRKETELPGENFNKLLRASLSDETDLDIAEIRYYAARLHEHEETLEKSQELIEEQNQLKENIEKQGINFVHSGNVRAQFPAGSDEPVFNEKGVDVGMAVDMVVIACDKTADVIILCSSDSDLQPAVKEAQKRGIQVYYLGFKYSQNKGLKYTTDKTILLENDVVIEALAEKQDTNEQAVSTQPTTTVTTPVAIKESPSQRPQRRFTRQESSPQPRREKQSFDNKRKPKPEDNQPEKKSRWTWLSPVAGK